MKLSNNTKSNTRNVTERERAAVRAFVAFGIKSKITLYKIAYDGTISEAAGFVGLSSIASRWWRSQKIQDCLAEETAAYDAKKKAIAEKAVSDWKAKRASADAGGDGETVDYTVAENLAAELNRIANDETLDFKTRLDAIKALASFKQETDELQQAKDQMMRFYVPIRCYQCALYTFARMCDDADVFSRYPELEEIQKKAADKVNKDNK